MTLPSYFCWTRFGTEAAQTIDQIFSRKEEERVANGGKFLWGIGNAVGPSLRVLLQKTTTPEVLFSPIKVTPRSVDVSPACVAAWTSGEALDGSPFSLPSCSLVTSRYDPSSPKTSHYALVCHADQPLGHSVLQQKVYVANLSNLLTGRPVGASQVTAIVQHAGKINLDSSAYSVAIRARLVAPYLVRLREPIPLSVANGTWADTVRSVWEARFKNQTLSSVLSQRKLNFNF